MTAVIIQSSSPTDLDLTHNFDGGCCNELPWKRVSAFQRPATTTHLCLSKLVGSIVLFCLVSLTIEKVSRYLPCFDPQRPCIEWPIRLFLAGFTDLCVSESCQEQADRSVYPDTGLVCIEWRLLHSSLVKREISFSEKSFWRYCMNKAGKSFRRSGVYIYFFMSWHPFLNLRFQN